MKDLLNMQSMVYVVATPIGNLEDMTPRALKMLSQVDIIAAEDTRRARQLLNHFDIKPKRLISYHDHNEAQLAESLINEISEQALSLALISDSGTPCLSDPGFRLIKAAHAAGVAVSTLPGSSAITALLSASGLPPLPFAFLGFLPSKPQQMKKELKQWQSFPGTLVFFESPQRIKQTVAAIAEQFPQAELCIGKELTKIHESIRTMLASAAIAFLDSTVAEKGEYVLALSLKNATNEESVDTTDNLDETILAMLLQGNHVKDILQQLLVPGMNRNELYQRILQLKRR